MMEWLENMVQTQVEVIAKKKDAIFRQKLVDKGYVDLANRYGNKPPRFPKLHIVRMEDGADVMYADNNTDNGEFIVAISAIKVKILNMQSPVSNRFELYFDVSDVEPQILNQDVINN